MLAICSDLDETPTRRVYEDTARFLNTTDEVGAMGPGVGLEVGNTMYFDMPKDQFSYWNTDEGGREMVRRLIRSGHIDSFHSYGDLATTRGHAGRALEDLSRHGCRMSVWIDHAVAPTNLGADIMKGTGDQVGSPAYHADLTIGHGVRYVWRGRVTSVIGQDIRRRLSRIFRPGHPIATARTLGREWAKGVAARCGSAKYAMHADNDVLRRITLRDGASAWEFLRANPFWKSVSHGETADGFGHVVEARLLDILAARGGTCILYTHLGKIRNPEEPLPSHTRAALASLARYQAQGAILVTTTRRVLDHARAHREVTVSVSAAGEHVTLRIEAPADLLEAPVGDARCGLGGLTVYVPRCTRVSVFVVGRPIDGCKLNPPDETGQHSVSLPFPRLSFPGRGEL